MTIDELRERKKELMARKKYELELQEQGKGDNFALFMVNEELLDINAQLRALAPAGKAPRVGRRTVNADYGSRFNAGDRQQFIDWARQDTEDAADDARAEMRRLLRSGIGSVSEKQRKYLLMWNDGLSMTEIAKTVGVDKSTVSRVIKKAKKKIARVFETQEELDRLRDGNQLDMSDPEVARLLLSALTPHQAVCFYLYFAEWLSIRQIGDLLGISHSSVCRTTHRAVVRINDVLGWSVDILDNVEGLDDLVFAVYRGLCDQGEDLPPAVNSRIQRKPCEKYVNRSNKTRGSADEFSPRLPRFQVRGRSKKRVHGRLTEEQHGKLFRALKERYLSVRRERGDSEWSHPITRWLVRIFRTMAKLREKQTGGS